MKIESGGMQGSTQCKQKGTKMVDRIEFDEPQKSIRRMLLIATPMGEYGGYRDARPACLADLTRAGFVRKVEVEGPPDQPPQKPVGWITDGALKWLQRNVDLPGQLGATVAAVRNDYCEHALYLHPAAQGEECTSTMHCSHVQSLRDKLTAAERERDELRKEFDGYIEESGNLVKRIERERDEWKSKHGCATTNLRIERNSLRKRVAELEAVTTGVDAAKMLEQYALGSEVVRLREQLAAQSAVVEAARKWAANFGNCGVSNNPSVEALRVAVRALGSAQDTGCTYCGGTGKSGNSCVGLCPHCRGYAQPEGGKEREK